MQPVLKPGRCRRDILPRQQGLPAEAAAAERRHIQYHSISIYGIMYDIARYLAPSHEICLLSSDMVCPPTEYDITGI
jgi:hypothetical protein